MIKEEELKQKMEIYNSLVQELAVQVKGKFKSKDYKKIYDWIYESIKQEIDKKPELFLAMNEFVNDIIKVAFSLK